MWPNLINTGLGIWLMCSPSVLGYAGPARPHDWITGPIIAAFALIACWEVTRGLRWVNCCVGLWLLLAPWLLGYEQTAPLMNSSLIGLITVTLSVLPGTRKEQFGGGWLSLFKSKQPPTS